jgi:hypothetical protein
MHGVDSVEVIHRVVGEVGGQSKGRKDSEPGEGHFLRGHTVITVSSEEFGSVSGVIQSSRLRGSRRVHANVITQLECGRHLEICCIDYTLIVNT